MQTSRLVREVAAKHYMEVEQLLGRSKKSRFMAARYEAAHRLMTERDMSHTQIANVLKRDRSSISNLLARGHVYSQRVANPKAVYPTQGPWSPTEDLLLAELYPTTSQGEIARRLGRPLGGVKHRLAQLGIRLSPDEYARRMVRA